MRYLLLLLFCVLLQSCDDFEGTKRFFSTDKEVYEAGDTLRLTLNITSEKEKKIRVYKNLKNIEIDCLFEFLDTIDGEISQTVNGLERVSALKREDEIAIYYLSPEKPFKKTIEGFVSEDENNFEINFKEYGLKILISKEKYNQSISFGFDGLCLAINGKFGDANEDFIDYCPIRLRSK